MYTNYYTLLIVTKHKISQIRCYKISQNNYHAKRNGKEVKESSCFDIVQMLGGEWPLKLIYREAHRRVDGSRAFDS